MSLIKKQRRVHAVKAPREFEVSITCMAEFYGVNPEDHGIDSNFPVLVYKDRRWQVGAPDVAEDHSASNLRNDMWAPSDDMMADQLYQHCVINRERQLSASSQTRIANEELDAQMEYAADDLNKLRITLERIPADVFATEGEGVMEAVSNGMNAVDVLVDKMSKVVFSLHQGYGPQSMGILMQHVSELNEAPQRLATARFNHQSVLHKTAKSKLSMEAENLGIQLKHLDFALQDLSPDVEEGPGAETMAAVQNGMKAISRLLYKAFSVANRLNQNVFPEEDSEMAGYVADLASSADAVRPNPIASAQPRNAGLLYNHCTTFMECLMQNIELELQESDYDPGNVEWWFKDQGLPEDVVQAAVAYIHENGAQVGAAAFEELHDEVWAKTEAEKDKWVEKWNTASAQYLAGRDDLTPEQKEEAADLLADEEDTIFWAAWGEAGSGVGHYEASDRSPWSNELPEMDIDGDDILKLMPSDFTLHEAVDNETYIIDELMAKKALQEVRGNHTGNTRRASGLGPEYFIPVTSTQLDPEVIHWFHSSMSDPVYAIGSRLVPNRPQDLGRTKASIEELEALEEVLRLHLQSGGQGDEPDSAEETARIEKLLNNTKKILANKDRWQSGDQEDDFDFDDFLQAYIEAALWSSFAYGDDEEEDDVPMDEVFGPGDLDDDCMASMRADCQQFIKENMALLSQLEGDGRYSTEEMAGHDFWLTRNGHGVGFDDRGHGELGEQLAKAAQAYGEVDISGSASGEGKVSCSSYRRTGRAASVRVADFNTESYDMIRQRAGSMMATLTSMEDRIRIVIRESNPEEFIDPKDLPDYGTLVSYMAFADTNLEKVNKSLRAALGEVRGQRQATTRRRRGKVTAG